MALQTFLWISESSVLWNFEVNDFLFPHGKALYSQVEFRKQQLHKLKQSQRKSTFPALEELITISKHERKRMGSVESSHLHIYAMRF